MSTSKSVCFSANIPIQPSKDDKPRSFNSPFCKYFCITKASVNELVIGVPVAKTAPLPPLVL